MGFFAGENQTALVTSLQSVKTSQINNVSYTGTDPLGNVPSMYFPFQITQKLNMQLMLYCVGKQK